MTGYINNILVNDYGYEYGYITGDDNNAYYFDGRGLKGEVIMQYCNVQDEVEFEISSRTRGHFVVAENITISRLNADNCEETVSEDAQGEIVPFFKPGFAHYMNKKESYRKHLKNNSDEDSVIDRLSKVIYITRLGSHMIDQRSKFEFCLAGATSGFKQYIQGRSEFLIVFSCFDPKEWQAKTLIAEREIRKRKEIIDRRPLVNFYLLVSNSKYLIEEAEKAKGSTNAAAIPLSFEEILGCKDTKSLQYLINGRFAEYIYENNMLGETNAIDDDSLLFGDRGKLADVIVDRCVKGAYSGIFGLRRSGKTSVLKAVIRRLEKIDVKYVKIESRSELESVSSWKLALYDISKKIRQITLGIEQEEGENRKRFVERLNLNSMEEDYIQRPAASFVEDVKLYCKDLNEFVIAIDEIELITFNTAKSPTWKNLEAFCGFWGALRDCGCSLIICGVNSTINELSSISYNGENGDNPMYKRILSCSDLSDTYLPSFTNEQTKYMINVLGGYSNICFSDVYTEINNAFGGQPYAIRQFCSFVFEKVKKFREENRLYKVSKATVDNLLDVFQESAEGKSLCKIILQHLTIFSEEYSLLKKLALCPDECRIIENFSIEKIDHLIKYGLINYDYNTKYISFKIGLIKNYICNNYNKNPEDMTNEERREYVQGVIAEYEVKLKTYMCNCFIYMPNGEQMCRNIMKSRNNSGNSNIRINKRTSPTPDYDHCHIRDFFNHEVFIMYFSSIREIISNNWEILGKKFEEVNISKEKFRVYMEWLNAGRTDADHYDASQLDESSQDWIISDTDIRNFKTAKDNMELFFASI